MARDGILPQEEAEFQMEYHPPFPGGDGNPSAGRIDPDLPSRAKDLRCSEYPRFHRVSFEDEKGPARNIASTRIPEWSTNPRSRSSSVTSTGEGWLKILAFAKGITLPVTRTLPDAAGEFANG